MKVLTKLAIALNLLALSATGSAAVISNFSSIYDLSTNRIQYTFDLNPVDGATPLGVDSLYFNYNPQNPPNPFIGGTTLLDATIGGASLGGIYDIDEIWFVFPTLMAPTTVGFILGGVDPASVLAASSYQLEVYANPNFGAACCYDSQLGVQYLGIVETEADFTRGSVPGSFGSVPEPASLALVGLGLVGLGFARRRKN